MQLFREFDFPETTRRSFWFQGLSCFNELPVGIQSLDSIIRFKHKLWKLYMQGLKLFI